jgi:hypothetical protein
MRCPCRRRRRYSHGAHKEASMLGVLATLKVKPGMEKDFEAVAKELGRR